MRRLTLLFITLFALSVHAQDQSTPGAAQASSDAGEHPLAGEYRHKPFRVQLGVVDYSYEEPGLMNLGGTLYSFQTEYRRAWGLQKAVPMYFDVNLNFMYGVDEYHGAIVDSNGNSTPSDTASREQIIDLQSRIGWSFFDHGTQMMDLYGGLGFWFLTNKANGTGSYTRDVTYIYLPLGIRYTIKPASAFKFTMGFQYNVFLLGQVKSEFTDLNPNNDDGYNTQHDGSGLKTYVTAELTTSSVDYFVEAAYQYWEIQDSDYWYASGHIWVEPHNKTKIGNLSLGVRF